MTCEWMDRIGHVSYVLSGLCHEPGVDPAIVAEAQQFIAVGKSQMGLARRGRLESNDAQPFFVALREAQGRCPALKAALKAAVDAIGRPAR